jgi:hypothetical protein
MALLSARCSAECAEPQYPLSVDAGTTLAHKHDLARLGRVEACIWGTQPVRFRAAEGESIRSESAGCK